MYPTDGGGGQPQPQTVFIRLFLRLPYLVLQFVIVRHPFERLMSAYMDKLDNYLRDLRQFLIIIRVIQYTYMDKLDNYLRDLRQFLIIIRVIQYTYVHG